MNGSTVNGRLIKNGSSIELKSGDIIAFGSDPTKYLFEYCSETVAGGEGEQVGPDYKGIQKASLVDQSKIGKLYAKVDHFSASPCLPATSNFVTIPIAQNPKEINAPNQPQPAIDPLDSLQPSHINNMKPSVIPTLAEPKQVIEQKAYEDISALRLKLLETEEKLAESIKEIANSRNECDYYKEEAEKQKAKVTYIELYASDLLKKIDSIQFEQAEMREELGKVKANDWTKRLMECNKEIEILRQQVRDKEKQYQQLQSQLSTTLGIGPNNKKHYETFIEEESKELIKCRNLISEYESRENICMKKWNTLLQENMANAHKIEGMKEQILRQKQTYENQLAMAHNKIVQMNSAIPQVINKPDKKQAAEFLVDQMRVANEEKMCIMSENENLHLQLQEFSNSQTHFSIKYS
jgi:hypothetical protein